MTRTPSSTRAAFTLLELMVALVAGIVTITVVYTLSAGSSRILGDQHRIAGTQTAVRLAMEQVRADIERAGLFGTPNALAEQTCSAVAGTGTETFQAVLFEDDVYTANIPNAALHGVQADRLVLTGNYVTTGQYIMAGISADDPTQMADGNQIALQDTWQSYRRDIGLWDGDGGSTEAYQSAFDRVFADGRWLHIVTLQGQHFFTQVTGRSLTPGRPPRVNISPVLPPGGICTVGLAHGSTVAPITAIEYAIVDPTTDAELEALVGVRTGETQATRNFIEGIPSVLVRREVNPVDLSVVPGTTRVVLENAVEFDLRFVLDVNSGPDQAPELQTLEGADAQAIIGPGGTSPQQVRSVEVRLSARTPDAESTYPFVERAAGAPLTRFYARELAADATAANRKPSSRVRTLVATAFIPNVAYADLP